LKKKKNNFIAISEISKQVAENYLNEIQKASSNYVSKNEILENENAELKKRIEELLKIKEVKDVK
jgi:regulator of replication initiation timing